MAGKGRASGFTLIELSIVLVIIGLIVGGILVGQDMIKAAETRAQISQIEKYNTAVNTFYGKFGALPGDMPPSIGNQFGFALGTLCDGRGPPNAGYRDGNGLIDAYGNFLVGQTGGETALFWTDLSSPVAGNLIDGNFPGSGASMPQCGGGWRNVNSTPGSTYIGDYLPSAKIGHGNFLYVFEYGGAGGQLTGYNWYGISAISSIGAGVANSIANIPVIQTYNIDAKIDDGLPLSGNVQAFYLNGWEAYPTSAATDTASTCYNTTGPAYSISSPANYGSGGNCALSFRFH